MKINCKDWDGWPKNRTAIIAEVGINHGGDENLAWKMIQAAHNNGADFVKIQSFVMENVFHPSLPYYSGTKAMELTLEAQKRLFQKAIKAGIKLITTPYDFASVDMVEKFKPLAYKIASMDNDNHPLIRYIVQKDRPVLISCGMADLDDIQRTVSIIEESKNNKLILLHCVSDYPTRLNDLNLAMINLLRKRFGYPVGLSDHSHGLFSLYIAASLGVEVIEKHFTIDRSLAKKIPDADHNISIEPQELKKLREFCEAVPIAMGSAPRFLTKNETKGKRTLKRGLYARRDISAVESLSSENTVFLRPAKGIKPCDWNEVCGKKILKSIPKHTPIFPSDIKL